MYTSYLAGTQKIEEIVTLNTLTKPIFNWSRLAIEIVMAARGWSNRDLVTMGNHRPRALSNLLSLGHGLTHWGRVTHIYISKLNIIVSDKGLSPGRRQAIICSNTGILLIRNVGINFREILSEIHTFSFKKMHLKISSAKSTPFCLGLDVFKIEVQITQGCSWYMRRL